MEAAHLCLAHGLPLVRLEVASQRVVGHVLLKKTHKAQWKAYRHFCYRAGVCRGAAAREAVGGGRAERSSSRELVEAGVSLSWAMLGCLESRDYGDDVRVVCSCRQERFWSRGGLL